MRRIVDHQQILAWKRERGATYIRTDTSEASALAGLQASLAERMVAPLRAALLQRRQVWPRSGARLKP